MPGPWQHYIPGLLRRYFGIKRSSGKRTHIWRYTRGRNSEEVSIKETSAEDDFYSATNGETADRNLDATIEKRETKLAEVIAAVRKLPSGAPVDSSLAAELVTHLSIRTRHVRKTMQHGASSLAGGIAELFSTESTMKRQLGLDRITPADIFVDALRSALKDVRASRAVDPSIPDALLENVLFQFARESDDLLNGISDAFQRACSGLIPELGGIVRNAHNAALARLFASDGPAWGFLSSLSWQVESASSAGAILPDCVAIGISETEEARPLLLVDHDELVAVVMPISSSRLLIGRRDCDVRIDAETFNKLAASCSYEYFEAQTNTEVLQQLADLIGTSSTAIVEKLADEAIRERAEGPSAVSGQIEGGESVGTNTSYDVTIQGCAESVAEDVAARVGYVVNTISRSLPLGRLDGITFASDYVEAVRLVDRGEPRLRPAEATAGGMGKVVVVFRDGTAKGRVVMPVSIAYSLVENPAEHKNWAAYLLTYELVLVSMIELVDRAFPGVIGRPYHDQHEGWLFDHAHSALDAFVASRFSAPVGDPTVLLAMYRDLLEETLHSAVCAVRAAKATYHESGDMEALAPVVLAACRSILESSAKLLGTADVVGSPAVLAGSTLDDALQQVGLQRWLLIYLHDLQIFHGQLGKWLSFADLLSFNRHVDRVMWSFGIASWRMPDGGSWVRVLA
jgi:hypothetical protein